MIAFAIVLVLASLAHAEPLEEQLRALGYLSSYEAERRPTGVLRRSEKAAPGLNFFTSGHKPCAFLMNLDGEVVREWCHRERMPVREHPGSGWFRRAIRVEDGIVAIYDYDRVIRLGDDDEVLWSVQNQAHHDFDIVGEEVWVLAAIGGIPVEDLVHVLDLKTGETKRSFSITRSVIAERGGMILAPGPGGDILHTNTLTVLPEPWKGGQLLVSFARQNAIAVLALDGRLTWSLTGLWRHQHEPVLLPNGNLLVFDNLATQDHSRVVEHDPDTQEVVWEYGGTFRSEGLGTVQRLVNGNTLIAESMKGRAIEVTSDGEIVWEWQSPYWHTRAILGVDADAATEGWRVATLPFIERVPE